jgi:hypothetical protein
MFRSIAFAVVLCLMVRVPTADAHPLSQGSMDVTIHPDRIDVHARVTLEEVSVTNMLVAPDVSGASDKAFEQHAKYLTAHLHFTADSEPLVGRVIDVIPPAAGATGTTSTAVYDLEYSLPASSPRAIALTQDSLVEAQFAMGQTWVAIYFVVMTQPGRPAVQSLVSRNEHASYLCDWSSAAPTAAGNSSSPGKFHLFGIYCLHGIGHILGEPTGRGIFSRQDVGFDHLLFVTALVLSVKSVWDLLKVVTVFTLAHTITLTLATLRLVHVSERISEPLIALSIVFVALQNVFFPKQSRGTLRLAAAFFFGLFHGLGFAGGLLDTMQEMHGPIIFLAILGFSIGVELAHQMVVLPLFFTLRYVRQMRPTELGQEALHFNIQRVGSVFISLAGAFYLFETLRMSFSI